jgi:hypothetical protein
MPGKKEGTRQMRIILTPQKSVHIEPAIWVFIKKLSLGIHIINLMI